MRDRMKLKRIGSVRRLRETMEKLAARKVAAGHAAREEASRRLLRLDEKIGAIQRELSAGLTRGIDASEISLYHAAWLSLREKRTGAASELALRDEQLRAATEEYKASRMERRKVEKWEENVAQAIRSEEDRKQATAMDEIAVVRHGW